MDKRTREYRNRLDSQYLSETLIRMASRNYALSSAAQTENPSAAQTDGAGKQKYASIPLPKIKNGETVLAHRDPISQVSNNSLL